jgi:curved DNA-binding protein
LAGSGPGAPGLEYKDYYAVLGVPRTASQADIKKAFRKLARQHHPDAKPGDVAAEERFKDINEANEVLSDPEKRQRYDALGSGWGSFGTGGSGSPYAGFADTGGGVRYEFHTTGDAGEFSDFFQAFFAGASQPNRETGPARGTRPTGGPTFEDILAGMGLDANGTTRVAGGRPAGSSRTGSPQRPSAEAVAEITLDEAYHGTSRLVEVDGKRLEITIPKGADTGTRIRLTGKAPGGGDLYVAIRQTKDRTFTRRGADLERELPLTLKEALLGADVHVRTLKGRVLLTVPAGTQPGRTFRLTGQGMPRFKADGYGDLYVKAKVILPTGLAEDARAAAETFVTLADQPDPRARET